MPVPTIEDIERIAGERVNGTLPSFAWPGGYPLVYITRCGEILCADCATEQLTTGNDTNDDPVITADVHWEGPDETCANCNRAIPSAYGDPDQPDPASEGLATPRGYVGVEHDDGTVHAIDLDNLHDDRALWREPPVCGRASGVSSDEGGPAALHRRVITCLDCIGILG